MKLKAVVVCAALALCAAQSFAAAHTEVTTAPRLPFMRGMGFFGFYGYGNDQYARKASVLETLKAKGFDHIRLPVDFRLYSTYDSGTGVATLLDRTYVRPAETWAPRFYAGFSDFDSIIDNAEAAGLYITLDFHGWFDINTTNQAQRAQFKAIWKAVAERYKDRSNKLIFELANEPGVNNGTTVNALNTLQKETVSIIRETNPTRLILYAVADANQPWALTCASNPPNYGWVSYPANDNNLALVVHSYNPGEFTHQGETWANPSYTSQVRLTDSHRSTLNWDLNQLTRFMKDHEIPLVMNEFNVSHKVADHDDITEYLSTITRYCEANGIPWSPWIYYNDGGGMDCFENTTEMYDFSEAGLFPDLKTTDKFSASDYPHAVDITFSGYSGSSALANFPVLVKLSEHLNGFHYSDFTKTNGFDLCFTDASGNLLAHEIDTWNTNGVSTVWVKVPSLTSSTKIVARYGCAKPIVPKVESVWDEDYVGVWHMGEQKLPLADSSNVSRDITSADGTGIGYGSSGIVGGSVDFGATGAGRCVNADDHANLDGFQKMTIEAWTYQTSRPSGSDKNTGIIAKRNSSSSEVSYYLYDSGDAQKTSFYVSSSGSSPQAAGNLVPTALNTWNHQVHTFDGSLSSDNAKGYLNGEYKSSGTANVSQIFAGAAELHIGSFQSGDTRNFPGKIDEVRISKCVRSADWIKASHDTVAKADFATYAVDGVASPDGPEEPVLPPVEYGQLDLSAFSKKMTVTFAGAQSGTTLTDFPVLVKLSTAINGFSYGDFQKANGGDLRFADANGNLLPHEIDTWNSNGVSTVWVKVPSLTKDTAITACWGCAEPPEVAAKDVWDAGYVGVWHLGESALPMKESSETSSDFATKSGTVGYGAEGAVGGAVDFSQATTKNYLMAADDDDLDGFADFTVEVWTRQDAFRTDGNYAGMLSKRTTFYNQESYFFYQNNTSGNTKPVFAFNTNSTQSARATVMSGVLPETGRWTHNAFTRNSGTGGVALYLDGTSRGTGTWGKDRVFAGSAPLYIGCDPAQQTFPGKIDEVRISKVARSAAWVKATHDTIASAGFAIYSFGEIDYGDSITNLLLKASTDKANPIDYVENEDIRFDFRLDGVTAMPLELRAKEPLHVVWTRTADDGVTVKGTNTISLAQGCFVTTKLATPGIVKMTGTLVGSDYKAIEYINPSDGKTKNITFGGGAGVATDKMQLTTVEPADFDQFWREAKQKLAAVPFEGDVELVDITPSGAASSYTIYAAKVPCFGPRPVTGWLTIPKNVPAGGLPIQASFDGYGCVSAIPKAPTWGYSTNVHFHINAHGYDLVNRDNQYYKDFNDYINKTNRTFNGTTYGYALAPQDYDNPTNTYFYYMAMRVMRAYDYLKSRPEWNGRDVIASGGSQGGLQTMWAGGLVDGITMIKPSITWGCDIGCPFNGKGSYPSRTWGIPSVAGAYYFDSALHAKRVPRTCIANITRLGMGDYTCPPRGVLLSYYNMKCAVSAKLVQGSDHGYVPPQPNQEFTISKAAETDPLPGPDRILYVNVEGSSTTNTLDAALVTENITNIVKRGAGVLVASAIPGYEGAFTLEGGIFSVGVKNGAGKHGYANTIYVGPGASLEFTGSEGGVLNAKDVILEGSAAAGAPGKFVSNGGWVTIGSGMSFTLKGDAEFAACRGQRMMIANSTFDLGGKTLTVKNAGSNQAQFDGCTFRNGGHVAVGSYMTFMTESGSVTFEEPSSGSPSVTLAANATFNAKNEVSAIGWTLYATNNNTTVCGNKTRWPNDASNALWNGRLVLGGSSNIATHQGSAGGVTNTVFNVKGEVAGTGTLTVGPGWLNLHTAQNTYSGAVTVRGQSTTAGVIPPGGGGIGLWNGAACFPNASSITFTNTARLAFMDNTACSVPNVKFVALEGETQSVSGGVHTARSTMAGFVKEGVGTLLIDSPVSVTGLADVKGGTLKIANRIDQNAQEPALMMAPLPQLPNLKFASGTTLDLSDNLGFTFTDIQGSPSVTNSGVFGVTGKWTLTSPNDVLKVRGEKAMYGPEVSAAGVIGFASGSTFDLADEAAFRAAVASAGADGLLVAEANWVMEPSQSAEAGMPLGMPTPAQGLSAGWSMVRGSDGRSVYLRYSDPSAGGYAAWIAGKGITGSDAAADKVTNGIANGIRYAFDIDPATSEIGTPIVEVVRDANGNPSVQSRDLATGRDDVTFGILATPDLADWSNATLVPMKKFASDGLWRPTASESSGYVFPSQMFFKYTIDIQE